MTFDEVERLVDDYLPPPKKQAPRPSIVIIDDDPLSLTPLEIALGEHYQVRACAGAIEGLAALEDEVDTIILDVKMPQRDGFWTFQEIRKKNAHIPIIFYSAFQGIKDPYEIINEYRPFGYFTKGDNVAHLLDCLERAVHQYQEHRQRDQQLALAERFAAMGSLAAGVAHEINNPLTYIIHNLDHLATSLQGPELSAPGRERLLPVVNELRSGVDRVRRITEDFKSVARVAGEESPVVDVKKALDSMIRVVDTELRHRAQIVRRYGEVPLVAASAFRLEQIFLNLLLNAVQAIPLGRPQDNHILLSIYLGDAHHVVTDISDTGQGISLKHHETIFQPFFTTKPAGEGTGLGLSTSDTLTKAFGGKLELIRSAIGEGSHFRLTLPVAEDHRLSHNDSQPTPKPSAHGLKILIIDDEPLVANALKRGMWEHNVDAALSGQEALSRCAHQKYDIILCDLLMGDYTGADFFHALRIQAPGTERRIIFITGGVFNEKERIFLNEIENEHLEKPIVLDELKEALQRQVSL